jgi:hypothetical protein
MHHTLALTILLQTILLQIRLYARLSAFANPSLISSRRFPCWSSHTFLCFSSHPFLVWNIVPRLGLEVWKEFLRYPGLTLMRTKYIDPE